MDHVPLRKSSWNSEEIQFLQEQGANFTSKEIAIKLEKKEETVKSMMRKLKLDWKRVKRTENVDDRIRELWDSKTPLQITEILNIPRRSIYSAAKRLGLVITTPDRPPSMFRKAQEAAAHVQREKSRAKAEEKFGSWTPISAYVLGVLWADGYVVDCGVALTVQKKDHEWHAMIGRWFKADMYIAESTLELNGKRFAAVSWTWGCVEGKRMLEGMGLVKRKSKIDPPYPHVPDEFFSHFARGLQDGDGSPTLTALRWYGSPKFMEGFREQALRVWCPIKPNSLLDHDALKLMQWGSKADTERIREHLYKDAGIWYLPRKKKHDLLNRSTPESDASM
jgi:hypothetical protein